MRIKIAARQSDLAKLQAYHVADALKKVQPHLKFEFQFRASLGDINQNDPLWKMPERGVFTEDFVTDLETGKCDLVVHSWKDLPTEPRKDTKIAATLPRVDSRDVLLFRKDRLQEIQQTHRHTLKVLTGSPRRAYNLEPFLKEYLPFQCDAVEFGSVRGNIQTRIKRLFLESADALVVAKAALDRLLSSLQPEFKETRALMRENLEQCEFMILPLSVNPTAAAQGALAIEIKRDRADLDELLTSIHCEKTFRTVELEREILAGYGGGCHQKIGVSVLARDYGDILFLRGLTDAGEVLNQVSLSSIPKNLKVTESEIWPLDPQEAFFFTREPVIIKSAILKDADLVWVARENALSEGLDIKGKYIWSAGLQTWKKLAARGIWVHGSSDSLGESEKPGLENLMAKSEIKCVKLTHEGAPEISPTVNLATYKLQPKEAAALIAEQLKGKTHFFWTSGSSFNEACKHQPWIRKACHACGPGNTYTQLRQALGPEGTINIYLSYESWKKSLTSQETEQK